MLFLTSSPSHEQRDESNSDYSDSSDNSISSKIEGNSETDGRSQDKMGTNLKDSTGTSVASWRTAVEEGNESESDDSLPQMPERLKDFSDKGKPTPSSCPNEPSHT